MANPQRDTVTEDIKTKEQAHSLPGAPFSEGENMDILLNLLTAAEAAYEMNPTPNMEKWIDSLEDEITQKLSQNPEKPQK